MFAQGLEIHFDKALHDASCYTVYKMSAMAEYRDYPSRWVILLAVFCLNISNNAIWISYSAVSDKSAEYYNKTLSDIDWLGSIGFIVGIPMCLASTWIVDQMGLRFAIFTGAILTFLGGLVRALSSFPGIGDHVDLNVQYWLAFLGTKKCYIFSLKSCTS